ncbi:MAG TPA: HAD-IA family hydrolase [Thermoleophilaceae bacterium]|nr:HAD-IA family hydrolase [Thermoleophilaceae bacterium]
MTGAVLLDALGTLVELQPPAPRLRRELADAGFDVSEERAAAGFGAEIGYYLAHHLDGGDRPGLEDLRDRCALALMGELGLPELDHATARRAMLAALEFAPYPDAEPALRELRADGIKLVIASNWDCSLPDWLEPLGLLDLVDAVVTSADVGAAKPDPALFRHALEQAGSPAAETVHVGDSLDNDVAGARAAGIRPLLLVRDGEPPPGVESLHSLAELPSLT